MPTITVVSLPAKIGRYQIVGRLATGGMAEVLLGKLLGPSGFERPVVVKRILAHLAQQSEFVEMFLDEARMQAAIHHPNVVQVHELGHEDGELFMVMEYLEGETTSGLMRRLTAMNETLDLAIATHLVAEVCAGLHAAHELTDAHGSALALVHRDVSPQNIFVTYSGQVKLIDFGVAKATDRVARTDPGQMKGKVDYMSPEQCRGEELDRRSDIFSAGIVLYELTTGRRLFKRASALMTLKAIAEKRVKPPSAFVPGYPAELDAICMRALQPNRDDRYATAHEMRRDLLAVIRKLHLEDLPGDALAALMQRLFADRRLEKKELLRRVQAGSHITRLPVAETDPAIEIPVIAFDDRTSDASALEPRRRRRGGLATLLIAILVLAGVAGALAFAGGAGNAIVVAPSPAAQSPESVAAPGAARDNASRGEVVIHIETTPPGARVLVAGEERGTTPLDLSLARSSTPVSIELSLVGHRKLTERVVPDVEQRLRVLLPRLHRVERPEAPAAPPGFRRFD